MDTFYEQNPPTDPAPTTTTTTEPAQTPAAPADTTSATDTGTELGATVNTTPATPAQPVDFWDQPADDDDLPPSLRGKPRKEAWSTLKGALAREHQAGFQKNEAVAQYEAQKRLNDVMFAELDRIRASTGAPPATPAQPYTQLGIEDPQQLFSTPGTVLNAIPQFVTQQVNQQVAQVTQGLQQQMAGLANQNLQIRAETAQVKARELLKMDEPTFLSVRPWLATVMANNGADPTVTENWVLAGNMLRQNAAKLIPATTSVTPAAPAAGNGRPAVTTTPTAKRPASTGNKHMDNALKEHLDAWNVNRTRRGLKPYTLEEFRDIAYADQTAGLTDES